MTSRRHHVAGKTRAECRAYAPRNALVRRERSGIDVAVDIGHADPMGATYAMSVPLPETHSTILVIDDDEAWRVALKDWLEREGFRVVGIARGEWTFAAIDLYRPALVVIDNQMPGPQIGLDLLPVMRQRWPELPIVMMTAFGGRVTADEALRRGATVYFDKPFRLADLVGEIRRHVNPGP